MNDEDIRNASITMLRETIEQLEQGQLASVAVAGVTPTGQTACFYTSINQAATIGSVRILEQRLLDDMAYSAEPGSANDK